ncbi:unnamed protein product [Cladocopium goreaui]|uniref:FAD dependent oxidoreductase domain-containing protein n=1 Tax=Cladocopium goreaui TaxID=2562237 RepID=A0A9P1DL30_9DINO|nr:unnamed protein product [Cladocopium goreaui]
MAATNVVVVGGGIVGASIAHYLAKLGAKPLIIEQCGVACHSSGKGAGFLALNWNDRSPVGALARRSFQLHQELADEFGAEQIGYRRLNCISCSAGNTPLRGPESRAWLDRTTGDFQPMGSTETLAQVQPRKLTEALVDSATGNGATLLIDKVIGMKTTAATGGVQVCEVLTEKTGPICCDAAVIAMGPWSQAASGWFPSAGLPERTALHKYTSVTFDAVLDDTAVFLTSSNDVQIYPREDETYACGFPRMEDLPASPLDITPCDTIATRLKQEATSCSSLLESSATKTTAACYLPGGSADGLPVIGQIPGVSNAFMACAHTCWGILNAPATGEAIAQMAMASGSVNLKAFAVGRSSALSRFRF